MKTSNPDDKSGPRIKLIKYESLARH